MDNANDFSRSHEYQQSMTDVSFSIDDDHQKDDKSNIESSNNNDNNPIYYMDLMDFEDEFHDNFDDTSVCTTAEGLSTDISQKIDNILNVLNDDNDSGQLRNDGNIDTENPANDDNKNDNQSNNYIESLIKHHYLHRFCHSFDEQQQTKLLDTQIQYLQNFRCYDLILCFCGQKFSRKNLNKFYNHLFIEHGQKYYECSLCPGKYFHSFNEWIEHLKRDDGLQVDINQTTIDDEQIEQNKEILRYLQNDKLQKLRLWIDEYYQQTIKMQLLFIDNYPNDWCTLCKLYRNYYGILYRNGHDINYSKTKNSNENNDEDNYLYLQLEKRFDHQCKHICYYRFVCTLCLDNYTHKYNNTKDKDYFDEHLNDDLQTLNSFENCSLLSDINEYNEMFLSLITPTMIEKHLKSKHSHLTAEKVLKSITFVRWMYVDTLEYQLKKIYTLNYGWNFDYEQESYAYDELKRIVLSKIYYNININSNEQQKPFINIMNPNETNEEKNQRTEFVQKIFEHYTNADKYTAVKSKSPKNDDIENMLSYIDNEIIMNEELFDLSKQDNQRKQLQMTDGCKNLIENLNLKQMNQLVISAIMKRNVWKNIQNLINQIKILTKYPNGYRNFGQLKNQQIQNICIRLLIEKYKFISNFIKNNQSPIIDYDGDQKWFTSHNSMNFDSIIELIFELNKISSNKNENIKRLDYENEKKFNHIDQKLNEFNEFEEYDNMNNGTNNTVDDFNLLFQKTLFESLKSTVNASKSILHETSSTYKFTELPFTSVISSEKLPTICDSESQASIENQSILKAPPLTVEINSMKFNGKNQSDNEYILDNYFDSIQPIIIEQISQLNVNDEFQLNNTDRNDKINRYFIKDNHSNSQQQHKNTKMLAYMKNYVNFIDSYDFVIENELNICGPGCSIDDNDEQQSNDDDIYYDEDKRLSRTKHRHRGHRKRRHEKNSDKLNKTKSIMVRSFRKKSNYPRKINLAGKKRIKNDQIFNTESNCMNIFENSKNFTKIKIVTESTDNDNHQQMMNSGSSFNMDRLEMNSSSYSSRSSKTASTITAVTTASASSSSSSESISPTASESFSTSSSSSKSSSSSSPSSTSSLESASRSSTSSSMAESSSSSNSSAITSSTSASSSSSNKSNIASCYLQDISPDQINSVFDPETSLALCCLRQLKEATCTTSSNTNSPATINTDRPS